MKEVYYHHSGIPPPVQRWLFACKDLQDDRRLSEYSVLADSTIHLMLRLCLKIAVLWHHDSRGMRPYSEWLYPCFGYAPGRTIGALRQEVAQSRHLPIDQVQLLAGYVTAEPDACKATRDDDLLSSLCADKNDLVLVVHARHIRQSIAG